MGKALKRYRRAAIYVRVSSEEQTRSGYSLADQEERCLARARELGAVETAVYADGGESGSRLERPGLAVLREALAAGRHDLVVALDPDRLARNLYLQLALHDELRRLGVGLEFVTMDWEDTPDGRLFMQMRGAIAEYEREKIRMRTYAGRRRKARQGGLPCGPVYAYGYRYVHETQSLVVDPAQAETVRAMFRWAAYGEPALFPEGRPGPGRIARRLNELGVAPCRPGTAGWHANTVRQMLRNRRYVGELVTFRTRVAGSRRVAAPAEDQVTVRVPALVDPETFALAGERLEENGRRHQGRRRYPYLLSGVLICGECGRPMHGNLQRLRRRTQGLAVPYYTCSGRSGCGAPSVAAGPVEAAVWAAVVRRLDCLPGTAAPGEGERAFLEGLLEQHQARRKRLNAMFRLGGLTEAEYEAELGALMAAAREVEQRLGRVGAPGPGHPFDVAGLGPGARRELCRSLIRRAEVRGHEVVLHMLEETSAH